MLIRHNKISLVPDGSDTSLILPSDWNADHIIDPNLLHIHCIGEIPIKLSLTQFQTIHAYTANTLAVYRNGLRERNFIEISMIRFDMTSNVSDLDEILIDYIKKE